MPRAELRQLTDQQLNDTLDAAGFARLEALLQNDAAARRDYLRYCFLHGELACADSVLQAQGERELAEPITRATLSSPSTTTPNITAWLACGSAAAVLLVFFCQALLWHPQAKTSTRVAVVASSKPSTQPQAMGRGTLRSQQDEARIRFRSGADVLLGSHSVLGVAGGDGGALFSGQLAARVTNPQTAFVVETSSMRVVDLGTEFGVSVNDQGETEVHVFDGLVETQVRVRLPRHYYHFDEAGGPPRNQADSAARGEFRGGSQRGAGIVGRGAAQFDNQYWSGVWLNEAPPESFQVSTGVTIEALILPTWSGAGLSTQQPYDYDEIFRKEDGHQRILLSFQNDHTAVPSIPAVPRGPCLAFGLNLAGQGYSELDMPLDGEAGRPTLATLTDGRPHHVVATYDSYSGVKAIYIDGRPAFTTQAPRGTLIQSGGGSPPVIGNLPTGCEPFSGSIDEFAFYDFALTADEVKQHYDHVQQGLNYFGLAADAAEVVTAGGWKSTIQLQAGQAQRFDAVTGLPLGAVPLDRARFATAKPID